MNSVNDLSIEMLNLTEQSSALLSEMPLDVVVKLVRRGDFPPINSREVIEWDRKYHYRSNAQQLVNLRRLGKEMRSELTRLGMIDEERFETKRMKQSAGIIAMRIFATENCSRSISYYFRSEEFTRRLIGRISNESYEKWEGFSEQTIATIISILERVLSGAEFRVLSMRFGLEDGIYRSPQEVMTRFGWKTDSGERYHEKNAAPKLYKIREKIKILTQIKC